MRFQSSPVPKDGCNQGCLVRSWNHLQVSILTRPEGRVQLALPALEGEGVAFRLPTMGWRSAAALVLAFLLEKQEGRLEVALRMEKSILGLGSGDTPLDPAVAGAMAAILQAL